ncbi:MAG: hypothetical protein AAFR18_04785 [Cyanobacteria bacterium J06627_32]
MKSLKSRLATFSFIGMSLASALPGSAQSQVVVEPDTLTVIGSRPNFIERIFEADLSETRNLALRATESVESVKIYTFDLYNSDRDRVFSKSLITIDTNLESIEANSLQNLPVTFDLGNAASGAYQGALLVSYPDSETSIPVTVQVKDAWPLPLFLLVLGVLLGTTTSSYTRWGRSADQLTVSMDGLRAQIEADSELPKAFASKIFPLLHDAKEFRRSKQLSDAQQAVADASNLWRTWARERLGWLAIISDIQDLDQRLQASLDKSDDMAARYRQAVQKRLKEALAGIAGFAGVSALTRQVNEYTQQLAAYEDLRRHFDRLQAKLAPLKGDTLTPEILTPEVKEKLGKLEKKSDQLSQQIADLSPANTLEAAAFSSLETDIREAMEEIVEIEEIKATRVPETISRGFELGVAKSPEVSASAIEDISFAAPAPSLSSAEAMQAQDFEGHPTFSPDENPILKWLGAAGLSANQRLRLFSTAGYLTTIVFLAGTGFNQLYLEKATFGEDGPVDYFSLVAWGFGAEATRNAITNVLRRTDGDKP